MLSRGQYSSADVLCLINNEWGALGTGALMYETDCILFCHKQIVDWVNNWHLYLQIFPILSLHRARTPSSQNRFLQSLELGPTASMTAHFGRCRQAFLPKYYFLPKWKQGLVFCEFLLHLLRLFWPEVKGKMMDVLPSAGELEWIYLYITQNCQFFGTWIKKPKQ